MKTITANELKTKGIASIRGCLAGKQEAALLEARADLKENNFIIESVADHLARIKDGL